MVFPPVLPLPSMVVLDPAKVTGNVPWYSIGNSSCMNCAVGSGPEGGCIVHDVVDEFFLI